MVRDTCLHRKVCRCIAGKSCPYFIDSVKCKVVPGDFLTALLDSYTQLYAGDTIKATELLMDAQKLLTEYVAGTEGKR